MRLSPARAPRRRPRRGSLERPVNGRLYRSSFLLVLAAAADRRVQRSPGRRRSPPAAAAELRRRRRPARSRSTSPGRSRPARPAAPAPSPPQPGSATTWRRTGCRWRTTLAPGRARPGTGAAAEPLGGRTRHLVRRDRRHGPSGQHRDRPGGERRRLRHGGPDRARAELCPHEQRAAGHDRRRGRAAGPHTRLSLHGRRFLRRRSAQSGSSGTCPSASSRPST